MSAPRPWYERVLGAALVLVGLFLLLPAAGIWLLYGVGLSMDVLSNTVPRVVLLASVSAAIAIAGGITLLRRS